MTSNWPQIQSSQFASRLPRLWSVGWSRLWHEWRGHFIRTLHRRHIAAFKKADCHRDTALLRQPLLLLPRAARTRREKTLSQVAFVILPNLTCSIRSKGCFSSLIRVAGSRAGFLRRCQTTCGGFSLTFKSRTRYHARTKPSVGTSAPTPRLWVSHHFSSLLFFFVNTSYMRHTCHNNLLRKWRYLNLAKVWQGQRPFHQPRGSDQYLPITIIHLSQPALLWWVSLCIFSMCSLIVFFFIC